MTRPLITLLTDFGTKDSYVAEMKGVILGICPSADIVDISHEVDKFSIRMGAYILASATRYFPKGTINVAVVDPGVGTRRRGLCVETAHGFYVGPDNGLLALATQNQGIKRTHVIRNHQFMLSNVSSTFHGRDVFAPVAAHLANGIKPSNLGPETKKILVPKFATVVRDRNRVVGEVIHIDAFGNTVMNIAKREIGTRTGRRLRFKTDAREIELKFYKTYGEVEPGEPLTLIGSHGFLEIAVNQGDASKVFKLKSGDPIAVYLKRLS